MTDDVTSPSVSRAGDRIGGNAARHRARNGAVGRIDERARRSRRERALDEQASGWPERQAVLVAQDAPSAGVATAARNNSFRARLVGVGNAGFRSANSR